MGTAVGILPLGKVLFQLLLGLPLDGDFLSHFRRQLVDGKQLALAVHGDHNAEHA